MECIAGNAGPSPTPIRMRVPMSGPTPSAAKEGVSNVANDHINTARQHFFASKLISKTATDDLCAPIPQEKAG
eukprot:CAMPEP_0179424100 /NCGR_PEP_ID=MMETSP0799-20121207/11389_1 /TAXON_ID=46947 /ORGANISM="Geminigera cryophila, Strain CCMP2564" /LENGTH=72 /DNA_ID=CAMNT_0021198491 /DNA_START=315 /DNA_END=533 /DNA_ORIENTATION=+